MTLMGGKRHAGVGMNRAQKGQRSKAEIVAVESEGDDEVEEAELDAPDPPLPVIESAAPLEINASSIETSAQVVQRVFDEKLVEKKDAISKAQHELEIQERSWLRVKETYVDSRTYSRWDEPSVVKRVEERMLAADIALGKARARVIQ